MVDAIPLLSAIFAVFITITVSAAYAAYDELVKKRDLIQGLRIELVSLSGEISNFLKYNNGPLLFNCYKKELKKYFAISPKSLLLHNKVQYTFLNVRPFQLLTELHIALDKIEYLTTHSENQHNYELVCEIQFYLEKSEDQISTLLSELKQNNKELYSGPRLLFAVAVGVVLLIAFFLIMMLYSSSFVSNPEYNSIITVNNNFLTKIVLLIVTCE